MTIHLGYFCKEICVQETVKIPNLVTLFSAQVVHLNLGRCYFKCHQCDQIWRNFAPWAKFKNTLESFKWVYLVFGKILKLLWQVSDAIGQFFIVINGQTSKKKFTHLVTLNAIRLKLFDPG